MLRILSILPLLALASAWECAFDVNGIRYDLTNLSTLRTVSKRTDTPPTQSEARVRMELCNDGIGREDGLGEEDQCPADSRACLQLVNIKNSEERVTSVIDLWPRGVSDDDVWREPIGTSGDAGIEITVQGAEYGGSPQYLKLTLHCSPTSTDPNPTFVSYTGGELALEWSTPDACPRGDGGSSGSTPDDDSGSGSQPGSGGGGMGFFGFLKLMFWMGFFGLLIYFAVGIFYNHSQYSARGWDLLPHRDFWREFPSLVSDLFSHVFNNVRGNGGRGGYNTLG